MKFLAVASCGQAEKLIKGHQVRDIANLPDVALDVGGSVAAQPEATPIRMHGRNRIAAIPQHVFQVGSGEFDLRKGRQFQYGDTTSQRFADISHQSKLLRAG